MCKINMSETIPNIRCRVTIAIWRPVKTFSQRGVQIKGNIMKILSGALACVARGPQFDYRSRRYDFRHCLSPSSSRDMAKISLKRRKFSKQPVERCT